MGGIVAARAKRYARWLGGRLAFASATLATSAVFRGRDVHLELDGGPRTGVRILNVAVANGPFHGAGMRMCPRARLVNGLPPLRIDVVPRAVRFLF
jgi:diacylglycerol kinase (ATP)